MPYRNEILRRTNIVIDIGVFIGNTPMYFMLKGVNHVIALELVPFYCSLLIENVKLNKLNHRIESKCIAVSGLSCILELGLLSFKTLKLT